MPGDTHVSTDVCARSPSTAMTRTWASAAPATRAAAQAMLRLRLATRPVGPWREPCGEWSQTLVTSFFPTNVNTPAGVLGEKPG